MTPAPAHDFDLLCIGSGPAGQRAAVQAAKLRKRVAIIESEIDVGGVCLRTGTIPSKTFREVVLSFGKSRETLTNGLNGNGHLSPEAMARIPSGGSGRNEPSSDSVGYRHSGGSSPFVILAMNTMTAAAVIFTRIGSVLGAQ
ncbi:MAG: FAD-binding protein [Alphaproteobacteria bacterium]|nr:FAD-binding protein [Alphaproteobacteria bacterium]